MAFEMLYRKCFKTERIRLEVWPLMASPEDGADVADEFATERCVRSSRTQKTNRRVLRELSIGVRFIRTEPGKVVRFLFFLLKKRR